MATLGPTATISVTDEGLGGDTGPFLLWSKSSVQLVDVALGHTSRVHPQRVVRAADE